MATFVGAAANDDVRATGGADVFRFGENEGVDVIVGFDPSADRLSYTGSSVDGFNDLDVSRVTINGRTSTLRPTASQTRSCSWTNRATPRSASPSRTGRAPRWVA